MRNSRAGRLSILAVWVVSLVMTDTAMSDNREFAEDVAQSLCAILAAASGNAALAGGTIVCKYGTRTAYNKVEKLIDEHFDGEDQEFADETCITIQYADGKTIKQSASSGCK